MWGDVAVSVGGSGVFTGDVGCLTGDAEVLGAVTGDSSDNSAGDFMGDAGDFAGDLTGEDGRDAGVSDFSGRVEE